MACRGIWAAAGWCLLLIAADVVAGIHAGIFAAMSGARPATADMFIISGATGLCLALVALLVNYGGSARRVAALRLSAATHGLIAVVLPLPLAVTVLLGAEWLERCLAGPLATAIAPVAGLGWWLAAAPSP